MQVLEQLKNKVARIEGRGQRFSAATGSHGQPSEQPWQLGLPALDAVFPAWGGQTTLPLDACHDITPLARSDLPNAAAFALALLKRLPRSGPIVWCQTAFNTREYGRLYPPGLLDTACPPERFVFVSIPRERDLALALEECLRFPGLAAVVGEGPSPDFTPSRRLTLTAQTSQVPCLILNTSGIIGASAAAIRWRTAPIAGPPDLDDPQGPGHAAWSLTLARVRGGNTARNPTLDHPLNVFWNHATHSFDLVSSFRSGKALRGNPQNDALRTARGA